MGQRKSVTTASTVYRELHVCGSQQPRQQKAAGTTGWAPGTVTLLSALSTWGVKRILNPFFFLAVEAGSPAPENMRHTPQG